MQVEAHDVEPERRRCPACGDEYGAHGSEDSEQLEIEVRAYRRVIKRRRYRCSCQCELAQQPKLPAACAKVLRSLRNHWQGLTLFVENPDLPMDNNQAERALRGPVVGRKNYYGSGAQWSGELSAALFSLFHTLERWRINPRTWLTEYLHACADAGGRVPADFERFLPWNRREARVPRASPAQVVDHRLRSRLGQSAAVSGQRFLCGFCG